MNNQLRKFVDGKTKVTSTAKYAAVEDLDGMVVSGM